MARPMHWHQTVPIELEGPVVPTARPVPLTTHQLTRARLRGAWELLTLVCEDADLLPPEARAHLAAAVQHLMEARALAAGEANT